MASIIPNEEFLANNYKKTLALVAKHIKNDLVKEGVARLFDDLGERYMMATASINAEYNSCFPGGLCYHNLNVLKYLNKLVKNLEPEERPSLESLIMVSIFHEIGKLGTPAQELYVPTGESWRAEKGMYFEKNRKIDFMRISHRSLYLANYYGVPLSSDEFLAILMGSYTDAEDEYRYSVPPLALLLKAADQLATETEKQNKVHWPDE